MPQQRVRPVLALMALAFSASVPADWVKMGETESYDVFVDADGVSGDGRLRKSWQIRNLKTQGRAGESDLFRIEHDCEEEKSRTLYWSVYSRHFAGGKGMKLGLEASHWSPVHPHTIEWAIQRIVCSKQLK